MPAMMVLEIFLRVKMMSKVYKTLEVAVLIWGKGHGF